MPYVLSHGKSPHGTDWINESAAECYLPLLHTLDRLLNEGIRPQWTINITPILAEQLEDPAFKDEFEHYCQTKIDYAIEDQEKFQREGPLWMQGLALMWQRVYTRSLVQFKHQWGRSIVEAFKYFQDQGCIEIITSGATHGYQPLLGTDESCQAQIKLGVQTSEENHEDSGFPNVPIDPDMTGSHPSIPTPSLGPVWAPKNSSRKPELNTSLSTPT